MLLIYVLKVLPLCVPIADPTLPVITSSSSCPNSTDMQSQAARLGAQLRADLAAIHVVVEGDSMRLQFMRKGGKSEQISDERLLPLPEQCADRVSLASVAIASWLGQVHSDVSASPLEMASSPVTANRQNTDLSEHTVSPAWQWGLGGMVTSADDWSGGVRTELTRTTLHNPLSWGLATTVGLPHSATVGDGTSRWTRATMMFGPRWTTTAGALRIGGDVSLGMTGIWAEGKGYAQNQSDFALLQSGSVGARGVWARVPSWWLDTRFVLSESSRIHAWSQDTSHRAGLAQVDIQVTVGASLDLF